MVVLSLFDGISCGRLALARAGIPVERYYASEIDKNVIQITMSNFPDTIQLGDVRNVTKDMVKDVDLILAGSPCTQLSSSGTRAGMVTKEKTELLTLEQYLDYKEKGYEFFGESYLFWEFVRILKEVNPKYFLLENVVMKEK